LEQVFVFRTGESTQSSDSPVAQAVPLGFAVPCGTTLDPAAPISGIRCTEPGLPAAHATSAVC
jgi:hypothetical protein